MPYITRRKKLSKSTDPEALSKFFSKFHSKSWRDSFTPAVLSALILCARPLRAPCFHPELTDLLARYQLGVGQPLNLSALASDCGITHNTAQSWLSVLEASYIVFLLKPHFQNFGKRLVKSPKLYFYDP